LSGPDDNFGHDTVLHQPGEQSFDDVYDNFYPQASSQWDSLGHVGYAPNEFYNGATEADVQSGTRNTIEHWARHAGRAVLLDMPLAMAEAGRRYDPGDSVAIGVEELELARRRAGVEFAMGDIILLHTGFAEWWYVAPSANCGGCTTWPKTAPQTASTRAFWLAFR
jgi:hypothetical protein